MVGVEGFAGAGGVVASDVIDVAEDVRGRMISGSLEEGRVKGEAAVLRSPRAARARDTFLLAEDGRCPAFFLLAHGVSAVTSAPATWSGSC